jgi:L-alanine-DL-glutamate epimerase-like enolase superfamily enzyme
VFVLKPAALGLLRAHEIGVRAQARGLDVVVTHLFDGPIGLAAACELALSLPRPPLACGLDAHAGLAAWPEVPVPQRRRDGLITAAGRPGLGIAPWTG